MTEKPASLHYPVMLQESVDSLDLHVGEIVVDCTVNRAGHSYEIAKRIGDSGTLIMFDLDKDALREAKTRLNSLKIVPQMYFIHSNFRFIKTELLKLKINKVHKIFADLGMSTEELEVSGRGFSFQKDEPLYMTFNSDPTPQTLTATDLITHLSELNLAKIFRVYGEERRANKIARAIVSEREALSEKGEKIATTRQLVDIIEKVTNYPKYKFLYRIHPATKIFQALRIAVNDEYESLKQLIVDGYEMLEVGGRMSILTFHSGEDRIVKTYFKKLQGQTLKQKPSPQEIQINKKSRSAILRTLIKTKH